MRNSIVLTLAALMAVALAGPAHAEGEQQQEGRRGKHGARKARILKKFDADGDGKLSETERASAKAARKERRSEAGEDGESGKKRKRCRGKARRGRQAKDGENENSGKRKRGRRRGRRSSE